MASWKSPPAIGVIIARFVPLAMLPPIPLFRQSIFRSRIALTNPPHPNSGYPPSLTHWPVLGAMIGDSVLRHRTQVPAPPPPPADDPFAPYRGLMAQWEEKERPRGWRRVWLWLTCQL